MITPKKNAPKLKLHTVSDEVWDLHDTHIEKFLMIVFYRGIHCPVCKKYLKELSKLSKQFNKKGILDIIAVSGDTEEKAYSAKEDWKLHNIEVGFDQALSSMKQWRLFISESIKDGEPKFFGEPGLFLIDSDHKIFYSAINSMPFGRPRLKDMVKAMEFINENNYPALGSVIYESIHDEAELGNPDIRLQPSGAPVEPHSFSL